MEGQTHATRNYFYLHLHVNMLVNISSNSTAEFCSSVNFEAYSLILNEIVSVQFDLHFHDHICK